MNLTYFSAQKKSDFSRENVESAESFQHCEANYWHVKRLTKVLDSGCALSKKETHKNQLKFYKKCSQKNYK